MAAPATPSPESEYLYVEREQRYFAGGEYKQEVEKDVSKAHCNRNDTRMAHIARHFQHLRGKVLYQMNWRSGRKYEKIRRGVALNIGTATEQTG